MQTRVVSMGIIPFSPGRVWAIMRKEFILMRRDPAVIALMAVLPLVLVCMAGYAINTYPKKVPTVLINLDQSDITRNLLQGLHNTGYYSFLTSTTQINKAYHLLRTNQALLVLTIPANFTHALLHRDIPSILVEDGGIDALSTGRAIAAFQGLRQQFVKQWHPGPLTYLDQTKPAFKIVTNRIYDPDHITQYYVVPGMIGLVLMLTLLMITTVIAFRDVQGGTIEYLLASPSRPTEILLAEILPYILIGYLQLTVGILLSYYLFHVPLVGNPVLLFLCALPYIVAELSLGLTIATFCATQFAAVQVIILCIALSVILTGFVFPIFGMPVWAQYVGLLLPLTHFFKILYGVMLKGNIFNELWPNLWPLLVYCLVMFSLAASRFRRHFR